MGTTITPTFVDGINPVGSQQQQQEEEMNVQMSVRSLATSEPQPNTPCRDQIGINVKANLNVELEDVSTVGDTVKILLGCVERGRHRGNQHPPSICMVPRILRDVSPSSFEPRMVSIGPLHKGHENVQEFEMQKETYLHDYLLCSLGSPPEHTLNSCVLIVNSSINQIKTCYAKLKMYTDVELAAIMVTDCCFILEFLHKLISAELSSFVVCIIVVDLMLVENQIPFFILQEIFECTRSESIQSTFLIENLLELRRYIDPFQGDPKNNNVGTATDHDHILGLLHKSFNLESESENTQGFEEPPVPHTAMELHRAGVNFKPNQDENWLMAMKYEPSFFLGFYKPWGKPTLRMPKLHIENGTEIVLRNFIAYEQSPSTRVHHYFTSYATAMDMLVDGQEDIARLVESKVVDNDLGSYEEAAKIINDICKEVCITEFFYSKQWEELDSYYRGYWPRNIAWLRRTYFNSPWNIIALVAGIILFALTVVQTVFTIKGA